MAVVALGVKVPVPLVVQRTDAELVEDPNNEYVVVVEHIAASPPASTVGKGVIVRVISMLASLQVLAGVGFL